MSAYSQWIAFLTNQELPFTIETFDGQTLLTYGDTGSSDVACCAWFTPSGDLDYVGPIDL